MVAAGRGNPEQEIPVDPRSSFRLVHQLSIGHEMRSSRMLFGEMALMHRYCRFSGLLQNSQ
jgi:hypothetical protein